MSERKPGVFELFSDFVRTLCGRFRRLKRTSIHGIMDGYNIDGQ